MLSNILKNGRPAFATLAGCTSLAVGIYLIYNAMQFHASEKDVKHSTYQVYIALGSCLIALGFIPAVMDLPELISRLTSKSALKQ
jgi:uncharacterized membrane protein